MKTVFQFRRENSGMALTFFIVISMVDWHWLSRRGRKAKRIQLYVTNLKTGEAVASSF